MCVCVCVCVYIYKVNTFAINSTPCKIRFTSNCTNKGIMKSHIIIASITVVVTTCYTASSSLYFFRVTRWCYQLFLIFISFINSTKEICGKQTFKCIITMKYGIVFSVIQPILGNTELYK